MSAIPEGWMLVPAKPNQDMVNAAKEVDGRLSVWKWADGYAAMLAADPQPPDHIADARKMVSDLRELRKWLNESPNREIDRQALARVLAAFGDAESPVSHAKPENQAEPNNGGACVSHAEMAEAVAAVDGTLHGAIDHWQERALKAEAALREKREPLTDGAQEALEVIKAIDSEGWALTRHPPSSWLTDAANKRGAWSVQRTEAPYCDKDDNRVWQGPTPIEALRAGRKAIGGEA
jgi:hypothetical protein